MFTAEQKKIIALSSLGGMLEFYDFIIFVFLAKLLGELFFPKTDPVATLMVGLTVFAIGYLARPLGGLFFGHFGDRLGRKKTFVSTVILMAIPTFLIGFLPTYHHIGISASIMLVVLRLLQGCSIGGEIPGAIVFITESVSIDRRGFATGLILLGVNMGILLGSFVSGMINHFLTSEQLTTWGWRIPFFIGGILGVMSYFLRKQLRETPIFTQLASAEIKNKIPFKELITHFKLPLIQGISITALEAVIVSILILFFPTYLATFFHYPIDQLFYLNTLSILIFSIPVLLTSFLSDQKGRKKIILVGILFFSTLVYPTFTLLHFHHLSTVVLMLSISLIFASCVAGVFPCMMAELFPTRVRYSGVALTYNIGFGIVGGLTPLLATELIHATGNLYAPSFILMAAALFALLTWFSLRETHRVSLEKLGTATDLSPARFG